MPKVKTHRGAAKRFKKTGGSKIKRGKAYRRHLLTCKNTKTKRQLRGVNYVSKADESAVLRMMPY